MSVIFKTITPLWTGDLRRRCEYFKPTGFIGSVRWWFEVLVRGMGYKVCDVTGNNKCQLELKRPEDVLKIYEKICPVCYLFGTTGWKSRFSVRVLKGNLAIPYAGKVVVKIGKGRGWHYESGLMGNIELAFDCKEEILIKDKEEIKLTESFPSILKILLYLISEHGMLGAKTSMGYGIVKCQINGSELSVDDNDWKNFTDFLSLFEKYKGDIRELPNIKDMFFVKFKANSDIDEIIGKVKNYYNYQDGFIEGNIKKWKENGWTITSPIVRKCIRCVLKGKYLKNACRLNRNCIYNYWFDYQKKTKNKNYNTFLTIDKLNLSDEETKNIRHFLMGSTSEPEFSAIQVSHVYRRNNELEFRIYGWLPDIEPIKDKRDDIIKLLNNIFQNPPWNNQIPSQIQNNICWNGSLSLINNNIGSFFKGESK